MKLSYYQHSSPPDSLITNSCTFHFDSFSTAQSILPPIIHHIKNLSVVLLLDQNFMTLDMLITIEVWLIGRERHKHRWHKAGKGDSFRK